MTKKNEEELKQEIIDLLEVTNKQKVNELFQYLDDLDYQLKRLLRNILKIKRQADSGGTVLREDYLRTSPFDDFLIYYLEKNGFLVKEEDISKGNKRFHVFEGTLEEVISHRLFERDDMIIVIRGETNQDKLQKIVPPNLPIFVRKGDNSLEELEK